MTERAPVPAVGPVPVEAFPRTDAEVAAFVAEVGVPGIVDIHVHHLPARLQQAVWGYFDRLTDPPWPIEYRSDEQARLRTLADLGVVSHTALAYPHRAGVAAWCNQHTLDLADRHPQVVPTFTFFPEAGVDEYVEAALGRGGRVAKVHLQIGRFDPLAPELAGIWPLLVAERVPVVLHAAAVYGVDGGEPWCGPAPVRRLLDAHPGLRLVIAHLGAPDTEAILDVADDHGDVLFDVSMSLVDPAWFDALQDEVVARVADRAHSLLFGSDYPTIPHPYAAQVRGLAALGLDREGLAEVLHDRARRLIDDAR